MAISSAVFSSVESLATQFYMPLYLKEITKGNLTKRTYVWNELASIMIPIYIGIAVYVFVFSPYLARLLVSEKFYDAYIYTMIGAVIELFRVANNIVYQVSQSELNTKKTILPYVLGFGIMIIGLYSIDVSGSFWKISVIIAVSYFITLVVMYHSMKTLLAIRLDWKIIVKTTLFLSPMTIVSFINLDKTLITSIYIALIGGIYLVFVYYILLHEKIRFMSAK